MCQLHYKLPHLPSLHLSLYGMCLTLLYLHLQYLLSSLHNRMPSRLLSDQPDLLCLLLTLLQLLSRTDLPHLYFLVLSQQQFLFSMPFILFVLYWFNCPRLYNLHQQLPAAQWSMPETTVHRHSVCPQHSRLSRMHVRLLQQSHLSLHWSSHLPTRIPHLQ